MVFRKMLALVPAICLTAALSSPALAQTTLRYAHPNAPESIPGQFASRMAELVKERTGGSVVINIYPASQLGTAREMFEGTQFGLIDMGHNDFAILGQSIPDFAVFNLPYLYDDVDHAVRATDPRQSPVLQGLNERLSAEFNTEVLGSFLYGIRELTANFPVYTPDDLRGKKIRAIPTPVWIAMVEGMGALPTPVDFSELTTALATGTVDGQENPLTTILTSNMYETQSHLMLSDHMINMLAVFTNSDSLGRLSDEEREAVTSSITDAAAAILELSIAEHGELIGELSNRGMTVIGPDDGLDIDRFRDQVGSHVRNVFPEWGDHIEAIDALK